MERAGLERELRDGFFPECGADAVPKAQRATGFQELGLPYASDPGVTRHLANFLGRHAEELARNLHDLVGQNLTALNLNLKLIQTQLATKLPTGNPVDASLDDARTLVEQVTVQVRNVMSELRPPMP